MKHFIIIALLIFPLGMLACSCGQYQIDLPIAEMGLMGKSNNRLSDIIFHGELIGADTITINKEKYWQLNFKVYKYYKGSGRNTISILAVVGGCYYATSMNTNNIIHAWKEKNGFWETLDSKCCKSIPELYQKERYDNHLRFLEIITNKIDGEYIFFQPNAYYENGNPQKSHNSFCISFIIKNGVFHGKWLIKNRKEEIIENGQFKNGQKEGKWYYNYYEDETSLKDIDALSLEIDRYIWYRKGKVIKTKMKMKLMMWNTSDLKNTHYITKYYKNEILKKQKEKTVEF